MMVQSFGVGCDGAEFWSGWGVIDRWEFQHCDVVLHCVRYCDRLPYDGLELRRGVMLILVNRIKVLSDVCRHLLSAWGWEGHMCKV